MARPPQAEKPVPPRTPPKLIDIEPGPVAEPVVLLARSVPPKMPVPPL